MIRINDLSVIESFNETVPKAAGWGEAYLKAVASGVQELAPPVIMRIDTIAVARRLGTPEMQCLVLTPTSKRIRKYESAHFWADSGSSLRVGWYQLGGDFADGHDVAGLGMLSVGAASDLDVGEVESIYSTVHTYAVLPAVQQLVDAVMGQQRHGGFFGA
jgi:hypothetical protein